MSQKGQITTCAPLSSKDAQKLLKKVPGRDGMFFHLGLYTAARLSEIRMMKFKDLLEHGKDPAPKKRITIVSSKQSKLQGKTVMRDLLAPKELQLKAKAYWKEEGKPPLDRYLFLPKRNWKGKNPMSKNSLNGMVKKWFRRLGVDAKNHSSHTLRKTMARNFYDRARMKGGTIDALTLTCNMLGHSNPGTTMRYIGLNQEDIDDLMTSGFYSNYKSLSQDIRDGELDLRKIIIPIKVENPMGPPSKWREAMEQHLCAGYNRDEVILFLDREFDRIATIT